MTNPITNADQAIEAAAKLAENIRDQYSEPTDWDYGAGDAGVKIAAAIRSLKDQVASPSDGAFQPRVAPWMSACFGPEISGDKVERGDRFLEEVFEQLQSGGYDPGRIVPLRDYVWSRPIGEPDQEAGGVMVTFAAYCLAFGLNMHEAGERELARIWTKVDVIREKQAAKPKHSPLPIAPDPAAGVTAREPFNPEQLALFSVVTRIHNHWMRHEEAFRHDRGMATIVEAASHQDAIMGDVAELVRTAHIVLNQDALALRPQPDLRSLLEKARGRCRASMQLHNRPTLWQYDPELAAEYSALADEIDRALGKKHD